MVAQRNEKDNLDVQAWSFEYIWRSRDHDRTTKHLHIGMDLLEFLHIQMVEGS
jgi:hypothetical protein